MRLCSVPSTSGFYLRKAPGAVQYLLSGLIEAHDVVPALGDGQVVYALRVATEVDGKGAVRVRRSGDVVHAVGVVLILFEVSCTGPAKLNG